MGKKLGGTTFVYEGNIQDYNYKETVHCLAELCDQVIIAAGGTDGTLDDLINYVAAHSWRDKVKIIEITEQHWISQKGREKLSYFSNIAIDCLTTDWNFYLQCDEILSEKSFDNVRHAIKLEADSYICKRYNLWKDPLHHLVVQQDRKPCSDEVIRLGKSKYRCFNDAESLACESTHAYQGKCESFEIWHLGYVRDPIKMVTKCRNMLVDIFNIGMDARIGDKFDYRNFPFEGDDIVLVPGPIPKFIKAWCQERYPDLQIP